MLLSFLHPGRVFIMLVVILSVGKCIADQGENEISPEEYRASIASFGVSEADSRAASQEAIRIAEELRKKDESDPMDSLPEDWLEGTPY